MSSRSLGALVLLGLVSMNARAESPQQAPAPGPVWAFGPGEQSTYKVEYLGVTAGTARITVGARIEQWGTEVWPIVCLARTESIAALFPIKDKFVTYWDPTRQRTIGSDFYADENRKRRHQRIKLDHEAGTAIVTKQHQGQEAVEETHEVTPNVLDVAAATFALRNKPLAVGDEILLPVFTGVKSFPLKAKVVGRQRLETRMGDKDVFKIRVFTEFSGKLAVQREMHAYLTADARHLPVRIEADFAVGTMRANLVEYQEGQKLAATAVVPTDS